MTWLDAVTRLRQPMKKIATDVVARTSPLTGIRAVIFDIYGTLVISGSGDVGSADEGDRGDKLGDAFAAAGLSPESLTRPWSIENLHEQIQQDNESRRDENCPNPEVDIVEIWRKTLASWGYAGTDWATDIKMLVRLAAEYEARANPTFPMPAAKELLGQIADSNLVTGIVSNAQVFTEPLVEDLCGGPLESCFDLDLCIFSYRYRQAKPGPRLFDALLGGLNRRGIAADQAVYVGNDMLNDVWAASQAGLKTAWFAGDARSCRPRAGDPRCDGPGPDVVLTDLMQLLDCLEIK